MYNKKLLKTITGDLDKAKAPAKKKDIAYDPSGKGMLNPNYAGQPVRLATDTLYNPTPYTIQAYADNGLSATLNPFDETSVEFPGAQYIDEYPSMKKGGSKKTSRSLLATNRLSKKNPLFKKKNYKSKTYDPQSMYFQDGGSTDDVIELELSPEEIQQYVDGGYVVQDMSVPELTKAQFGKTVTLQMSPYSLNANGLALASKKFGEYNPELLLGVTKKLPATDQGKYNHNVSLDIGLPYTDKFVPSVKANYHGRYTGGRPVESGFMPTVHSDFHLGYDPQQGLNFGVMANPRAEFANYSHDKYLKQNWPQGAWKGYAGLLTGAGYRGQGFNKDVGVGDIGPESEKMAARSLIGFGLNAGFEMKPFRHSPVRFGVDANVVNSLMKKHGEVSNAEANADPGILAGNTPMIKANVVYPLGTNMKKYLKKAEEQKEIDDEVFDRKEPLEPTDNTPDSGDGGGDGPTKRVKREKVKRDRKKREYEPISLFGDLPIGYLPGYDPETGREVPESYTRNAYGFGQGPTMYRNGGTAHLEELRRFTPGGATDLDPATMAKYLAALKVQENEGKKGYKNNLWYPHSSVEGGMDTIAYGHKLTPKDQYLYKGIDNATAESLQKQDVLAKQALAKTYIDKKYGAGKFDSLPQDAQMLLVDYEYNVGLKKFPSFVDALVKGDKDKMYKEYERGSSAGKLVKRNKWTKGVIDNLSYGTPSTEVVVPEVPAANVPDATYISPSRLPLMPLTNIEGYEYGGSLPEAQNGIIINDPKEYAHRKQMYDDSLFLYNNSLRDKKWLQKQTPIYKDKIGSIYSGTNWNDYVKKQILGVSKSYDRLAKANKKNPTGKTTNFDASGIINGKDDPRPMYSRHTHFTNFKKPVQPVYRPGEMPVDQSVSANPNVEELTKLPLLPIRTFDGPVNERVVDSFPAQVRPEQANMAFRYRDQWQHAYNPSSGKFKLIGNEQAPLPYGEKLNEHPWEYNSIKEIPEAGHHVWMVGKDKYYTFEEAKAAAAQWDAEHSYTFEDGGFVIGDEVDTATMERLKRLGYTFEEI